MSDDGRVFPISKESFIDMWKRALIKSKLLKIDSRTNRMTMHPHSLRKYFRTRGQWTQPDAAEALMGHIQGVEGVYARYDQAEDVLVKCYLEAESHLSISANNKTIVELRDKVDEGKLHYKTLEENLKYRNDELENQLYKIKADLPKMIDLVVQPYIDTVNELLERLGAVPQEE